MGAVFNPTDGCIGNPLSSISHPLEDPGIHIIHIMIHAWLHLKGCRNLLFSSMNRACSQSSLLVSSKACGFFGITFAHQSERMVSTVLWNVEDASNRQTNKFRLQKGCWFQNSRVSPNVCQCEDTLKRCITWSILKSALHSTQTHSKMLAGWLGVASSRWIISLRASLQMDYPTKTLSTPSHDSESRLSICNLEDFWRFLACQISGKLKILFCLI